MQNDWFNLCPGLGKISKPALDLAVKCAEELSCVDAKPESIHQEIASIRKRYLQQAHDCPASGAVTARVVLSVLCDLRAQGWTYRAKDGNILALRPEDTSNSDLLKKERIRSGLLLERDEQLRANGTREFIAKMERRRVHAGRWVSIFSLMRDGRELAAALRRVSELDEDEQPEALRTVIDPYVQVVDDSRCEHTGLLLKEIWRYFRHTWVISYRSVPGRNIWFLIRDRAVENHPVVGIAALGSPIVQLTLRDRWVGWTRKEFLQRLEQEPTDKLAQWVAGAMRSELEGIYLDDFLAEGVVTAVDLEQPDMELVDGLMALGRKERKAHELYSKHGAHKSTGPAAQDWNAKTRTYLFRSKRALALADLMKVRMAFQETGFDETTGASLAQMLKHAKGRDAVSILLRRVKAASVGNDVMDIIICGAVQPYNAILGGKLVSLLMTSPEVAEAHDSRYADMPSIIASSMAGKAICRRPKLVLLGTTSLYGIGSSQYNRLLIPAEAIGGEKGQDIRYVELGQTRGFGSYHLSAGSLKEMEKLLAQRQASRRVNSIFGEGVNPRLRKIRDALNTAGLDGEQLLLHGDSRIIYAIPLATNFREMLLGLEDKPKRIFPDEEAEKSTKRIAQFWRTRWLKKRIKNAAVLDEVERHTLVHPIRHGARVIVPAELDDGTLFAE